MIEDNVNFYAENNFAYSGISIYILSGRGNSHVAQPVIFVPREPGTLTEPTITVEREAAQILMDTLWQCGIRPTEGTGSAGQMAATEKHLADMRRIAFKCLKMGT